MISELCPKIYSIVNFFKTKISNALFASTLKLGIKIRKLLNQF